MRLLRNFVFVCLSHIFVTNGAFADVTVLGRLNVLNKNVKEAITNYKVNALASSVATAGLFFAPPVGWMFMRDTLAQARTNDVLRVKYTRARRSLSKARQVLEQTRSYLANDPNLVKDASASSPTIASAPLVSFYSNFAAHPNHKVVAQKISALNNSGMDGLFSQITLEDFINHDYYEELVSAIIKHMALEVQDTQDTKQIDVCGN